MYVVTCQVDRTRSYSPTVAPKAFASRRKAHLWGARQKRLGWVEFYVVHHLVGPKLDCTAYIVDRIMGGWILWVYGPCLPDGIASLRPSVNHPYFYDGMKGVVYGKGLYAPDGAAARW